jgi:quercetin dioxygenase-like cupin family protein
MCDVHDNILLLGASYRKQRSPLSPTFFFETFQHTRTWEDAGLFPMRRRTWSSAMARPHQPGQETFRSILPEDVNWQRFPAFPPAARLAVLIGHPAEPAPYVIRVKVPGGTKLMPHKHPEDRIYTVISGVFYIGLGEKFDGENVKAYPPGSVIVLPGETWHFHWAKSGEYVTQVSAIGPLGLDYHDADDDPRQHPQT